jgi:AmmeMemoRadiSam system protein B
VVLGLSRYVAFREIAAPVDGAFRTPLGDVPLGLDMLAWLPGVFRAAEPHRCAHAIEVELPFLQRALRQGFGLVLPMVGDATDEAVGAALEPVANDPETLLAISSDLSHYLDHASASRRDRAAAKAIGRRDGTAFGPTDADGFPPLRGWLHLARRLDLLVERLDLKDSGDTGGGRGSVVGYGAWAFATPGDGRPKDRADADQSGSSSGASSANRSPGPGFSGWQHPPR